MLKVEQNHLLHGIARGRKLFETGNVLFLHSTEPSEVLVHD